LHWAVLWMAPSGFIALLAGWTVTEVGRQPWTVYGLMRTADSVSPVGLPGVAASLAGFMVVYFIVFGAGLLFVLRLMARPPGPLDGELPLHGVGMHGLAVTPVTGSTASGGGIAP
jgi:cytochrome d ubiquinol oxidase subunit I